MSSCPKTPGHTRGPGQGTRLGRAAFPSPLTGKKEGLAKSFDSEEEAAVWAAEQELKRKRGTLTEPSRETLAAYGRAWLEEARDRLKRTTWHGYSDTFRRYVEEAPEGAPQVGRVRMDRLRPEHVQRLYIWLRKERGLSRATVQGLHAILRQVLAEAFDNGAIDVDIAARLRKKIPRERNAKRRRVKAMTQEQLERFLAAAKKDRYAALWYLLATTGMRPGEALALTWDDLDFEERRVRVHRTLSRVSGEEVEFTDPKTSGSIRVVALPQVTIDMLREHRRGQAAARLSSGRSGGTSRGSSSPPTRAGSQTGPTSAATSTPSCGGRSWAALGRSRRSPRVSRGRGGGGPSSPCSRPMPSGTPMPPCPFGQGCPSRW